ncbi:hypothetical protein JCM10295v2_003008 [Rhodotorula toruloides]
MQTLLSAVRAAERARDTGAYMATVAPFQSLWEGFTRLPALEILLLIDYISTRTSRLLTYIHNDLANQLGTDVSYRFGQASERLVLLHLAIVFAWTLGVLSRQTIIAITVLCYSWILISASRRKSIHKDANGTALLLCPDMLRGTPFRFIRYDNLVIATFESFQALEQFVKLEAPLFQVILAAVKTRRDLKNKLREEENEKDMAGACSSRRSY